MRRFFGTLCLTVVLGISAGSPPVRSESDCPFGSIGENVLLVFSVESWDALWEMARAPGLGDELAVSIREELLPAILEESGSQEDFQSYLDDLNEISERVDWEGLAASRIDFLIWGDSILELEISLQISPPQGQLDSVDKTVVEILRFLAEKAPDAFHWKEEEQERSFSLVGPIESATPMEVFHVNRHEDALWITAGHTTTEAVAGQGLVGRDGFSELWNIHPFKDGVSFVVDFSSLANLLGKIAEDLEPMISSSLVLDETMEDFFKDDPETLEKLKTAQEGMEIWSSQFKSDPKTAAEMGIDLLDNLGLLLCRTTPSEKGISSGTYWRPTPESTSASLFELEPLSARSLSLLETGMVEVSLRSLPDIERLYDTFIDLFSHVPGVHEALATWESLQDSIGFHVKKDLFPAIGREVGWLTRQVSKGGMQSFPIATNELYVFQEIGEASTAKASLGRLEELLTARGMSVVHKRVGEASFTVVDTGFLGQAMWGLLEDPAVLVFVKGADLEFLQERIDRYHSGEPGDLSEHPRWDSLKSIWREDPNAVTLQNAGVVHNQLKGQLQSAQMMISMMGAGNPVVLAGMGLVMQVFNGTPTPDWSFRVDYVEGDVHVSRSLLLYPLEEEN